MNALAAPQTLAPFVGQESADSYYRRRLDEASASGLKRMLKSPAHFRHWCEDPDAEKSTPALAFGKAFHCATLEPDVFAQTYAVQPVNPPPRYDHLRNAKNRGDSTREAHAFWDRWDAEHAGRIALSAPDYDRAQRMADSVRAHPVAAGLLVGGDREVTFRWIDPETGLACKSRKDLYLRGEYVMDLKSCTDASPEGFARSVIRYEYDVQQGHYLAGVHECGDEALRHFIFLAVESEAPYVCQPHVLDTRAQERGWNLRQRAIKRQAECLKAGRWPGYSDQVNELSFPAYAFYQEHTA